MSNTFSILGCPRCGAGKNGSTHTYGAYRVYKKSTDLKLVCKTCKFILRFRFIDGGQNDERE